MTVDVQNMKCVWILKEIIIKKHEPWSSLCIRCSTMSVDPNVSRAFRTSESDIFVLENKKNASKHESLLYIRIGRDNGGAPKSKLDAYFVVLPYILLIHVSIFIHCCINIHWDVINWLMTSFRPTDFRDHEIIKKLRHVTQKVEFYFVHLSTAKIKPTKGCCPYTLRM